MPTNLADKTDQYERLLAEALDSASPHPGSGEGAEACLEMAEAYLTDGRHFQAQDNLPDALAAFAYGHGWLDAGARLGVLSVENDELFTI